MKVQVNINHIDIHHIHTLFSDFVKIPKNKKKILLKFCYSKSPTTVAPNPLLPPLTKSNFTPNSHFNIQTQAGTYTIETLDFLSLRRRKKTYLSISRI